VKLNVWDTAGQERFRSVSEAYFRNAVLVFALDSESSFTDLEAWLADLHQAASPNAVILLEAFALVSIACATRWSIWRRPLGRGPGWRMLLSDCRERLRRKQNRVRLRCKLSQADGTAGRLHVRVRNVTSPHITVIQLRLALIRSQIWSGDKD
jgi:hypothetical protein